MAYFRCGQGGGSSLTIQISTTSESLYGQTITISKSGSTVGTTTFDNTGNAEYTVDEAGTYTVSATVSGTTYSDTVEVTDTFEASIEAGFNYHTWLAEGDVSDTYSDLAEVLADELAVRKLMTIHDAVDYLAGFTSDDASVVTILNNDLCAKWISLRDYAMDVLEAAYDTLMGTIGKYGYGEWALLPQVPNMTSATAPYGTASGITYGQNADSTAWKAFDGNDGTETSTIYVSTNSSGGGHVAYEFVNHVIVKRVYFVSKFYTGQSPSFGVKDVSLYGSDDGLTWTLLASATRTDNSVRAFSFDVNNNTAYTHYKLAPDSNHGGNDMYVEFSTIQFYAYSAKGNVPIMTSNTAPYGEASRKDKYSGEAYNAFDGNDGSAWIAADSSLNSWIQYKFTNPVIVKRIYVVAQDIVNRAWVGELKGSNDGTNFTSLKTNIDRRTVKSGYEEIDNDTAYLYYRLDVNAVTYGGGVSTLQFYGRELKVSVPTMTGNTSPYGEAIGGSSNYEAYRAFMGFNEPLTSNSHGARNPDGYFGYKFSSPVRVTFVRLNALAVSGSTSFPAGVTLKGANSDGVWHDIATFNIPTFSIVVSQFANAGDYTDYGLFIPNVYGDGFRLELFGKDYSEREWDTEHPRHYIYDHGLELDTFVKASYNDSSAVVEKRPSEILLQIPSPSGSKQSAIAKTIDLTDYELMRMCVGDEYVNGSYESLGVYNTSYTTVISRLRPLSNLPYNVGVDVSSDNSTYEIVIETSNKLTVTEWWLE